ncbi:MAG: hypothetical protein ACK5LN_13905 [Propioniciclava sp.]
MDLSFLQAEHITDRTGEELEAFRAILHTIENSGPNDTAGVLRDNLKPVWNASKSERGTLLEILGCCEILEPGSHDRKQPGRHDWDFVTFWRGEDKYNKDKVKHHFESFGFYRKLGLQV